MHGGAFEPVGGAVKTSDHDRPIALVDRAPDAVLFRSAAGAITTAAFLRDARQCAAALPDGDHVVNCCQDRYQFAVAFAAALLRGQVSLLIGDQSARALAALNARFTRLQIVRDDPAFVCPLPHSPIGTAPCAPGMSEMPRLPAGRLAAIAFTSGSSGEPVGTPKTFGELAARSQAAGERFGFRPENPSTIVGTVPPNHMYGFETTILLPLHAHVASWCGPVFYPADIVPVLDRLPTDAILVTTPLQLRALLQAPAPAKPPTVAISATAPLDLALATQAERLWHCETMEIFGATEVGSIASRRPTADPIWSTYSGITLTGEEAPLVHAPGAPPRRFNDVVELLDGGHRFRLIGRCGDMVKLAGRRASLAGLTRVLNELDGVEDGIFMAPDDLDSRPTARLLAFIVAPERSRDEILAALRRQIDPIFLPRPLLRVDALPRNALGKLPREALLALARQAG